jgi:hypothetical protein
MLSPTPITSGSISANYFIAIDSLTAEAATGTAPSQTSSDNTALSTLTSPILFFGPFFIFIIIFLAAFGIQLVTRIVNRKQMISAAVLSLCLAFIPFVLQYVKNGIGSQSQAGPDTVPRSVVIKQLSQDSVLITWTTGRAVIGAVRYGFSPLSESSLTITGDTGRNTNIHTIKLERLIRGKFYDLEIYSFEKWYLNQGQPIKFSLK